MTVPRRCLLCCLLALAARADVGRGLHKKIYAVPAPGPVTIDGDLREWDLSGQIRSYVVAETAEMMSARLAVMYDQEALYVSGVVRDISPLMNRHDPKVDPEKAWDADVCQLWFSLDPDLPYPVNFSSFGKETAPTPVATAYLWYFTDRREPCLSLYRGMKFHDALRPDLGATGVVPPTAYAGAYRLAPDKLGYTFEYRLPFATLGLKRPPHANDLLAACFAVFWSQADGLKTAGGHAWAYDVMNGPGFPFQQTNCWGKLAFSAKGKLPREQVEEGLPPEPPLPLRFSYDLPADRQVTVQLHDAQGVVRRILVAQADRRAGRNIESWDGLDDQGQPLPEGKYTWRGVQHDRLRWKALFSVHNSGVPPWPTDDNRGGWGGDHGTPTCVCPVPNGLLLAWNGCEYGWGIIRVDVGGRKQWGSKHCAAHLATDGKRFFTAGDEGFNRGPGITVFDLADGRPLDFGAGTPRLLAPPGGDEASDEVTGLAWLGGKLYASFGRRNLVAVYDTVAGKLAASWTVPSPQRLAVRADGTLLVLSGNQLLTVGNGEVKPLVTTGLDQPRGVAVAADGTLFVSCAGAAQDVAVFDAAGALQRRLGMPGGRPALGRYDPDGMYQPGGLGLDARGRVWVAETADSPKRVSVWDAATGRNVAEFFGSSSYFGYGYIDPARPNEMYAHNVLWGLDWKTFKSTPLSTIWRKTAPDMIEEPNPAGYAGVPRLFMARDGHQYLWAGARFKSVLLRREGDVFKPFAATISIYDSPLYGGQGIPCLDDKQLTKNGNYLWQDANSDQRVQRDEVVPLPREVGNAGLSWVDADLNLWLNSGHRLSPLPRGADDVPRYDVAQLAKTPAVGKGGYLWLDPDGSFYRLQDGKGFGLAKWSAAGELRWSFPNQIGWHDALNLPMSGPGRLHGMTGPMGVAGPFTANMTYFGPNQIFTRDGIYVGAVLQDGRLGVSGSELSQPEGQGGQFVRLKPDPQGPERYFVIHGGQDSRVWEVLGLDSVEPLRGGVLELTAADVALAKTQLDEYKATLARGRKLTIARGRTALDTAEPLVRSLDLLRRFEVRAAYDANNLYLRYDVTAPSQLVNAETEPQLLFRGGNCLDLQLATDPAADPQRKEPAPGDLRVLVTRQAGRPFALAYRPRVAGFTGTRIVLKSPTGQEAFDAIEPLVGVLVDYAKTNDGFRATVTLPLAKLGWRPQPGQAVKLDLGYLFGNDPGTRTAARAYWSNNGFAANVINDVPHESRLEPGAWGMGMVE